MERFISLGMFAQVVPENKGELPAQDSTSFLQSASVNYALLAVGAAFVVLFLTFVAKKRVRRKKR